VATVLLYHWYVLIVPLPAIAVTDKAVAAPLKHIVCAPSDVAVNDGKSLTVNVSVEVDEVHPGFEIVHCKV
jgi:hypothetical protein